MYGQRNKTSTKVLQLIVNNLISQYLNILIFQYFNNSITQ